MIESISTDHDWHVKYDSPLLIMWARLHLYRSMDFKTFEYSYNAF